MDNHVLERTRHLFFIFVLLQGDELERYGAVNEIQFFPFGSNR